MLSSEKFATIMPRTKANAFHLPSGLQLPSELELETLSLQGKQGLLHVAAKNSDYREILMSWKKKDILELLCLEIGKERKYTGVPKSKLVDHLLKLIALKEEEKKEVTTSVFPHPSTPLSQGLFCRQQKGCHPSRLTAVNQLSMDVGEIKSRALFLCRNSVCKAHLSSDASFCKRCSCCICHQFDDNKDPSLWIVCNPDDVDGECGCGISCHIECAFDQELAGVVKGEGNILLDGSYRCESCGTVGDLIGIWRKQLLIAKDARRVDILCHRLSLSHRLFDGTYRYKELHEIIVKATKKLESEVGPIMEGSAKLVRGIVNRLSSWVEVQKLIVLALEKAESLFPSPQFRSILCNLQEEPGVPLCTIHFQDVTSVSISVRVSCRDSLAVQKLDGFRVWHCRAHDQSYPRDPSFVIYRTEGAVLVSDLQPCTEYMFKVVLFSAEGNAGNAEACCFTKKIEAIPGSADLKLPVAKAVIDKHDRTLRDMNVDNDLPCGLNDLATNFKVRDLGKMLHGVWNQNQLNTGVIVHQMQDAFGRTEKPGILESDKLVEHAKMDHLCSGLNILSSFGGDTSSVDDGGCKKSKQVRADTVSIDDKGLNLRQAASSIDDKGINLDDKVINLRQAGSIHPLDLPEELNASYKDCGVTLEVVDSAMPRKGSSALEEKCPNEDFIAVNKVTEAVEVSDPRNSQTYRAEEIDAACPVASGSVQTVDESLLNRTVVRASNLGSKGHGENSTVQVRMTGRSVDIDPEKGIFRKRIFDGLEKLPDCFLRLNACTGTDSSAAVCAAKSYELCVKMIRWLECEGHIKEDFRMKFLTWFSLRATEHEKRIVNVFIDTLQDNPTSLAEQLVDTFGDIVSAKRQQVVPHGFCNRLWH